MIADLPWNVHPDLKRERLIKIAQLIAKGRNDAVLWHNPGIGDDTWVLGCRAFQASRHQVMAAAGSDDYLWLKIVDSSKHLVFMIGEVPVRFYRGPAEEPTSRTLRQNFPELTQLSMVFSDDRRDLAYRFAVETHADGTVAEIKFAGLLGETPMLCWLVPLETPTTSIFPIASPAEGVELPPPIVGIPGADDEKDADETGAA